MSKKQGMVIFCTLILAAAAGAGPDPERSVQVEQTPLRSAPSFLAGVSGTVRYGDRVTVTGTRDGWAQVRTASGDAGWVHASTLSERRIVLRAGETDARTGASGEEIALAGKGFNEDVEQAFRQEHDAEYTWVDRMETIRVTPAEARVFVEQGRLRPEGGRP